VIRVNLLPQQKRKERLPPGESSGGGGGHKWLLLVAALLVLEVLGLAFFHNTKVTELDAQKARNTELNGKIAGIKQLVANHEEVKKSLAELRAREEAIAKLETARTGPTAVLLELAQLLTPGKGPTADPDRLAQLRKDNPLQVYSPGWDARRLWINSYKEKLRVVEIQGNARDSTDISELAYRLKISSYFYDVKLLPGKRDGKGGDLALTSFAMSMKVRY
jgi:type IV pilus assembly protein PilN